MCCFHNFVAVSQRLRALPNLKNSDGFLLAIIVIVNKQVDNAVYGPTISVEQPARFASGCTLLGDTFVTAWECFKRNQSTL